MVYSAEPAARTGSSARLFVLELGMNRPLDFALSQGTHELKDCGVAIAVDGPRIAVSWLGHGPRAFLLPGARQLQRGQWQAAEDRARVSWAGREWLFLAHALGGDEPVPARGICCNGAAPGFPAGAVLLVESGKDRGNFYRFRTEPFELAPGVRFVAVRAKDGSDAMHLRLAPTAVPVTLDGQPAAPGSDVTLASEQVLAVADMPDQPGLSCRVLVA